jgi:hypothetical protein
MEQIVWLSTFKKSIFYKLEPVYPSCTSKERQDCHVLSKAL